MMMMRLTQELEQGLEQRLIQTTALQLMEELDTEGNREHGKQLEILQKIKKDLETEYQSLDEFHFRVMKRVKKPDRTPGIRQLIAALRQIIPNLSSLEEARAWVEQGIKEAELLGSAHDFYAFAASLHLPYPGLLDLAQQVTQHSTIAALSAFEFLHNQSENGYQPQDMFGAVRNLTFRAPKKLADTLRHLESILPKKPRSKTLEQGVTIAEDFSRLLTQTGLSESDFSLYQKALTRDDLEQTMQEYSAVPLFLLLPLLQKNEINLLERAEKYCSERAFREGTDIQRNFFYGLNRLNHTTRGKEILEDILTKAKDAKQAAKIFRLLNMQTHMSYPFGKDSGDEIVHELEYGHLTKNPLIKLLDETHREKLFEQLDKRPSRVHLILTTLAEIYNNHFKEGMPLLKQVAEAYIDENFNVWRIGHEKGAVQLAPFEGPAAVVEEFVFKGVIGDTGGLEAKLNAITPLVQELSEIYAAHYQQTPSPELLESVRNDYEATIGRAQQLEFGQENPEQKKTLGKELGVKRIQYDLLELILNLCNPELDEMDVLRTKTYQIAKKIKNPEAREKLEAISTILNTDRIRNYSFVTVTETTSPKDLLEVGTVPVQTCQRWTEPTSFNQCLLAYVADVNKSIFQMGDAGGRVIGRSVIRYLHLPESEETDDQEIPLVLAERLYATEKTEDLATILMGAAAAKALQLSARLHKPIAVGASGEKDDALLVSALEKIGKKYDQKLSEVQLKIKLPESMNACEYSDSFGGMLPSGKKISGKVHYLVFESE